MEQSSNIKVENLYIYPIKSSHELELQEAEVIEQGLLNDRILCIFDSKTNKFLTMRTHPALYFIEAKPNKDNPDIIEIKIPNNDNLFKLDTNIDRILSMNPTLASATIWDDPCQIFKYPTDIDLHSALTTYLKLDVYIARNIQLRYVKAFPFPKQLVNTKENDNTNFADLAPILITTVESLEYVNKCLKEQGKEPLEMKVFRPNIVLSGINKEFWEDKADNIKIGNIVLRRIKACVRCKMTTFVEKENKFRKDKEPLGLLSEIRFDDELNGVTFGQNYSVDISKSENNIIKVNDQAFLVN